MSAVKNRSEASRDLDSRTVCSVLTAMQAWAGCFGALLSSRDAMSVFLKCIAADHPGAMEVGFGGGAPSLVLRGAMMWQ